MKKIEIKNNELTLKDDQIIDFFEKEVTPHGTGGKIPCSSKYIGKKAYVIITENDKRNSKKDIKKN
jgi:putative transposon-encoded protein